MQSQCSDLVVWLLLQRTHQFKWVIVLDYSVCYTAEGQPECSIWSTYYELSAINCDQYSSVKSTSKAEMLQKYYFKWTGRGIWPSVIQPLLHCCARKHSALFVKQLWCLQLENANLFAAICLIYYHCLQNYDSNCNVRARQFWCQSGKSIDALILNVRTRCLEGFYSL